MSPDPSMSIKSSLSSSTNDSSPFQMMDIEVSVDIMEGLIMEYKDSQYSQESYASKASSPQILGTLPITAFVSCKKNVSSTRTISTHVPSLPLNKPTSSHGGKHHHFVVRWPADFDPHGDALSTFKLSRLMRKESTGSPFGYGYGYVPEEIELTIGLMRGSDMISLGLANLVITGEETEEMIIDLPINITKEAVKESKKRSPSPLRKLRSQSKSSIKILKAKAFPGDTKRKYRLSEQSMIRLQVKISPQVCRIGSMSDEKSETSTTMAENSNYDDYSRTKKRPDYYPFNDQIPSDELHDDFNARMRLSDDQHQQGRAFGKELPRHDQDYSVGQVDYNVLYGFDKSRTYEPKRHNDMGSSHNYYAEGNVHPYGSRDYHGSTFGEPYTPTRRDVVHHSASHSIPRSNSYQRSGSMQRSGSTLVSNGSTQKAGSAQRSSSTQRSNSRQRSRALDPQVAPDSIYDRTGHSKSKQSRDSSSYKQPKPKVQDENSFGVTNWFFENVIGHIEEATSGTKTQKERYPSHSKTRESRDSRDRHTPPLQKNYNSTKHRRDNSYESQESHSFDSNEYYNGRDKYYGYGDQRDHHEVQNDRLGRRVSSLR